MANLPSTSNNNNLSWQLSDRAHFPLATSNRTSNPSRAQSQALISISSSAISAYDSASRLSLGLPQRIMIETQFGPVLLHSYLNTPRQQPLRPSHPSSEAMETGRAIVDSTREELRPLSAGSDSIASVVNGVDYGDMGEEEDDGEDAAQKPPLLVVTVVARTSAQVMDARRAAADIERFGRQFQRDWELQIEEGRAEEITATEDG